MLEVLNISKSFGRKKILDNISFNTLPGSLTGIVGENGAGKSTLLKIIIGEISADNGSVKRKGSIGYCPQQALVFPTLTIRENFDYFASGYGLKDKGKSKQWDLIRTKQLQEFGLEEFEHQRVEELSGGTRQKLNLSISLLHDPDICILDEPYGGFDWTTYQHFWEVILQLKANKKNILIITHLLNDLKHFDLVYSLKDGKLK